MASSNIRDFLWKVAGSDRDVLLQCNKREQARHVQIGMMIVVTTIFAAFAGGLAGYEIGGNTLSATVLFGAIWAILIFAIDRTMVITIQKEPGTTYKIWRGPFIIRMLLALIISFVISIPLELQVFKEEIRVQMDKDRLEEAAHFKEENEKINNVSDHQAKAAQLQQGAQNAQALALGECMSVACDTLRNSLRTIDEVLRNKRSELATQKGQVDQLHQKVPLKNILDLKGNYLGQELDRSSRAYQNYSAALTKQREFERIIRTNERTKVEKQSAYNQESAEFKAAKQLEADSLKRQHGESEDVLTAINDSILEATATHDSTLATLKGFLRQYEAMNRAADDNWHLTFFIWLIRVLFFVIELLPTVSKMSTSYGGYDEAMGKQNDSFVEELSERLANDKKKLTYELKLDLEIAERALEAKQKLEEKLNLKVIEKIASVQFDLAEKYVESWKGQQMQNINVIIQNQGQEQPIAKPDDDEKKQSITVSVNATGASPSSTPLASSAQASPQNAPSVLQPDQFYKTLDRTIWTDSQGNVWEFSYKGNGYMNYSKSSSDRIEQGILVYNTDLKLTLHSAKSWPIQTRLQKFAIFFKSPKGQPERMRERKLKELSKEEMLWENENGVIFKFHPKKP